MNRLRTAALSCALALAAATAAAVSAQTPAASPTPSPAEVASATPSPSPVAASAVANDPKDAKDSKSRKGARDAATDKPSDGAAEKPAAAAATTKAAPKGLPPLPLEKSQPVTITKFDAPPVIDGKLDDAVWKKAALFNNFYQIDPGDNTAPTLPTETFIGYDSKFLYIAFHCYDDPSKVRATVAKRDDILGSEDTIRVLIDTFNDQRKAYVLAFNPLGIQQDGVRTEGQGADFTPDIVMTSKGSLVSDGWVVEVAVPFKSLRYEAGKGKLWGLQILRITQRLNAEQDSWMPISRDVTGLLNQAGHITGLEGISAERTVELIPSITVGETGRRVRTVSRAFAGSLGIADQGKFVNQPIEVDPGLTAKLVVSSAATIDLAINPDFAQVEADATVNTANQRFPIFFDEKRPFFLEGIDIFRTTIAAVHTRTIIDPDVAVKLTGKRGRNTYGVLFASDNAPGDFTNELRFDPESLPAAGDRIIGQNAKIGILRVKHDIGKESNVGFLATAYDFVGKQNFVGGFDSRIKFDKQTSLDVQVLGTNARRCALAANPEDDRCRTLNGFAYAYVLSQNRRHLGWNINGVGRTSGYRADVGFTRRLNTNNQNFNIFYTTEPQPKKTVVSWEFDSYLGGNHDWQGRMQNWTYEGQMGPNLQRQTFVRWGYNTGYERDIASEFGVPSFARGVENSGYSKNVFAYAGSTPTKRLNFFYFYGYRWGEMDYDFGGGPRFPRVSPAALADPLNPDVPLDPGQGNLLYTNGNVTYKATNDLNMTLSFQKNRLTRHDTGLVAFDSNIVSAKATYQFTRFAFMRARLDYDSLFSNYRGQFLFGWAPNPGTAFYVGYNDDMNRNFVNPFSGEHEPGFRRNGRTFFIKASYLFRRSF
jgi:Domain of unknown function (DUF5916)/Carbohydrate family 9 binding domain-like